MNQDISTCVPIGTTVRELLYGAFSRYLNVTPDGLQINPSRTERSLSVTILTYRPARTLYQAKKPVCRSLDGIQSMTEGRTCASCLLRKTCTPQVYLELLHDGVPYRLILAYTSARNFLAFASGLRDKGCLLEGARALIAVRDRGRWGEVCFLCPPDNNV
jgi:hypothetical protein